MNYYSLSAAQDIVLQNTYCLGFERVPLALSLSRVLAEDIYANRDHPPYAVSAMDGYAVRESDLHRLPIELTVVEDVRAGTLPTMAVMQLQCARIMTGAALPQGADTVIRVEDTLSPSPHKVSILKSAILGTDVRQQGEHLRTGELVLQAGTVITPGVYGILAMTKYSMVSVVRQPSVAILSTGDELEALEAPFNRDKIPDANSHTLYAQVLALGITPVLLGIAEDDPLVLARAIQAGLKYDVLLISGGTSVGVHDYVRPTLADLNIHMHFWRVAIRPGHPIAFGTTHSHLPIVVGELNTAKETLPLDVKQVFCLPGNPVSSMVCFEQFVAPALRRAMGHTQLFRRTIRARLTQNIEHRHPRLELVRVRLQQVSDTYEATPTGAQGSGVLLSMAYADGLLVVPAESTGLHCGDLVVVQCLDNTSYQAKTNMQGEWL